MTIEWDREMRVTVARMRDEGATLKDIARKVGVSVGTLTVFCHKNGISTRPIPKTKWNVQPTYWKDARSSTAR